MQLRVHPTMDCSGRSTNNIERDSDLGDDLVSKKRRGKLKMEKKKEKLNTVQ